VAVAAVLLVALNMGPSLGRWRLTGHHRIAATGVAGQECVRL
jgi:hypothetical protein